MTLLPPLAVDYRSTALQLNGAANYQPAFCVNVLVPFTLLSSR